MSALKYEKVPTSTDHEINRLPVSVAVSGAAATRTIDRFGGRSEENIMAITNLPSTNSSQQLMGGDTESVTASFDAVSNADVATNSGSCDTIKRPGSRNSRQYDGFASITYTEWFTVIVLCFVNLINYMDRFTIAGKCNR